MQIFLTLGGFIAIFLWTFFDETEFSDDDGWLTLLTYLILFFMSWVAVVIGLISIYKRKKK